MRVTEPMNDQQTIEPEILLQEAICLHQAGDTIQAATLYEKVRIARPDIHLPWYFGGAIALAEGNLAQAKTMLRRAVEIDGSIADFQAMLGTALLSSGSASEAVGPLARAVDLEPNHAEAGVNLGLAYLQLERFDLAVDQLKKSVARHPTLAAAQYALGTAYRKRERLAEAFKCLSEAAELEPTRLDMRCDLAEVLMRLDRLADAERIAQSAVTLAPRSPIARCTLGNVLRMRGRNAEAYPHYTIALDADANYLPALFNLANASLEDGLLDDAIELYERALRQDPTYTDAQVNLAEAYRQLGRLAEAESLVKAVALRDPNREDVARIHAGIRRDRGDDVGGRAILERDFDALYAKHIAVRVSDFEQSADDSDRVIRVRQYLKDTAGLLKRAEGFAAEASERSDHKAAAGFTQKIAILLTTQIIAQGKLAGYLSGLGQGEEANDLYRAGEGLRDRVADSHRRAGLYLYYVPDYEAAIEEFNRGLALAPDNLDLLSALGGTYCASGKMEDTYRVCRAVLDKDPKRAGDWNNVGLALQSMRREQEAIDAFQAAIDADPTYLLAWTHMGSSYQTLGRITEAREAYEKALDLNDSSPEALNNLAIVSQTLGDFAAGQAYLRRAIEAAPDNAAYHSNILFAIQYLPEGTEQHLFEETMRWGEKHAAPHYAKRKPLSNDADPNRRLRIGYVSPDFKGHSCSYFLYPLYTNHDRKNYEIFSYAEVSAPDMWTDTFKGLSDHWFSTVAISDDDVAERIRKDKIDVLVDLGAHTGGSRLLISARKPAPVQVSWLGLGNSTGVRTMDYFISDPHMVPDGYDKYFCEQVYRLPNNTYCYYPLNRMPDVGPVPSSTAGHVTFGTLSRSVRLNEGVLKTWARILNGVPNSRLMINTVAMNDPLMRDKITAIFAAEGISADRLDLIMTRVPHETWGSYNIIDIALDPFPHNAGLTTFEAIYMGAPVVTLADRPPQGRYGASILSNVGLSDLIAYTLDDYVSIAINLANNPARLAEIKSTLRDTMLSSPLCDGAAYTKAMEDAYRSMWKTWCADQD